MASVFRASCAIYWIVWLVSLAYLLGMTVYESKFVVKAPPEYQTVSTILKMVCYICISYSVFGCIFVKCDISHICCFLLYSIPLLVFVPGLCIYGLVKCRAVPDLKNETLLADCVDHWKDKNKQPNWLEIVERSRNCCGIGGWTDYTTTINPDSKPINVPSSCCKNSSELKENGHCVENSTAIEQAGTFFWTKGCGQIISRNVQGATDDHCVFFIILIIFSLLMLLVYVKNWCGGRHFSGGHSQHSLDVENISVMELPSMNKGIDTLLENDNNSAGLSAEKALALAIRASQSGRSQIIRGSMQITTPAPGTYVPKGTVPTAAKKSNR